MRNAPPGEYPLSRLRQELDVTRKTVVKWQEALRDKANAMVVEMSAMGVVYDVRGVGRGAKSYLVKLR